ncbi:hypothetical protein QAD02_019101 [Eretmocerus hayati]|uniref:Uncharacterized protein n=1 Tax=Eretmocerus hayati TaxID=131215 RepID=A0ACC2PJ41_9HYME|nr:hypothetical protein QAD02_019101 [Eretmocerus hayati]
MSSPWHRDSMPPKIQPLDGSPNRIISHHEFPALPASSAQYLVSTSPMQAQDPMYRRDDRISPPMTRMDRMAEHYLLQEIDRENPTSEKRVIPSDKSPEKLGDQLMESLESESKIHLLEEWEFMERYFPTWKENHQKLVRASDLAKREDYQCLELWPQEGEVQYKKQDITMPPSSPPYTRHGQPAEYHCIGPAELVHPEEKKKLQNEAKRLAPTSSLRANAPSWHPPGFSKEPTPIGRQDVRTLSSEEFWKDYAIYKVNPKCIRRPPLQLPKPTVALPNHIPQFGVKQHCTATIPTNDRNYKIFLKPGIRGYAKGVAKEIMDACQCVIVHIWVPRGHLLS